MERQIFTALTRSEMKKIKGGDDPLEPALCNICIEDLSSDPYHVRYYAYVPCLEWHCPIEEPPGPVGP